MPNSISVPTDPNCKARYSCTLAGSAEVHGDHYATLAVPEHLKGEYRDPFGVTWHKIDSTIQFLFTSDGETYELRFYTPTLTASPEQLEIKYGVTAIYAPLWAALKSVITATRDYDPCCAMVEADTITSSVFAVADTYGSAPLIAAGVSGTWSYRTPTPCLVNQGSGVGAHLTDAQGGYRGSWCIECATINCYTNTDNETGGSVDYTLTWSGGNKPYQWLDKSFSKSFNVTASTSNGQWKTNAGLGVFYDVTVTQTATVSCTVSKISGQEHITVTLSSSTASIASATTYNSGSPANIDATTNPTAVPTLDPIIQVVGLPCTDCSIVLTAVMTLMSGSPSQRYPISSISVTALIMKV